MATSKLNYANIRAAQRKNKSMHEAQDLLPKNHHPNSSIYAHLSPPFPLDQPKRTSKEHNMRTKMTYSLFDEPPVAEIPSYAKSLFGRYHEEPLKHEEKIAKGHHRVKSSITEMYHKGPEILEDNEHPAKGATFGRFETNSNRGIQADYETLDGHESLGGMVARLEEDARKARERGKENSRAQGISGQLKEGRMLGDFLRKNGGFGKETASPDDMRPRKKELSISHEQGLDNGDKKNGVKLFAERSPKNISIEDNLSSNEDFLSRLDNYIDYFKKSERSHRKSSKGANEYVPVEDRGKSHEEGRDTEMKIMKKHVDGLNAKLNEVMKANKKILKEFGHMLIREDEYNKRLGGLEEDFALLQMKNKKYREKLKSTIGTLKRERIENENNMHIVKKMLSSGVNMMLENKIRKYVDDHREKQPKYATGLREGSENSAQNRKEDRLEKNDRKERNSSEKRPPGRKEGLFGSDDAGYLMKRSHKRSMHQDDEYEEDEDKLNTIEQEDEDLNSTTSENHENRYRRENVWSPSRTKESSQMTREQKIRMLQERLAELMGDNEYPLKHEQHDKVTNQVWPRNLDTGLLNNTKQVKPRNLTKDFMDINVDKYGYSQNIRERQGSQPKVNSFCSRGEAGFE